jgi:hypothetical protein
MFCASPFVEGVFSTRHTLAMLAVRVAPDEPMLVDAIGDRVHVGGDPDDRRVGRDWMSCVPLVHGQVQHEVGEVLAYLAELNHRRWEHLVRAARDRRGGG